ncbi:segregation and condensation protein A [Aureibacter tunicatorum]|uniref:Segregation and condensation protein A n=1 Tax=Aureibacter tunicatorum TaxID=866807 RepID=A0AAE4BQY8_9BACT|nr:segregation/condensation protein A [Aureibacter tunicatorum]MDR6239679.1 segregation and condensation protein A [Aureibacter tunicatorum]BDD04155.1 segregation and condensation protein A [Aureibacter tunicatorum]
MDFEIKLPLFEGPFDLLLFFIERDEIEIHDIPISRITDEFLSYLQQMEELNIEVASEFILMAATLMKIKSKMLIPRPELDEQGDEVDPRDELVSHLIEYKKFKKIAQDFSSFENHYFETSPRGNLSEELKELNKEVDDVSLELHDLTLYHIFKMYNKVMKRYENEKNHQIHSIVKYPYTIVEQKDYIMNKLLDNEGLAFGSIVNDFPTKIGLIFNFLAVLDLLQLNKIRLELGEGYNNFMIHKSA